MGARHSQHRYSHPTNTTFEQDAVIGGTGGAVLGLMSGVGYFFVNQVGLRGSITLMGFAVVSGTIVGAIVCVAGAVAIRSLAWLYRQLRKRTRHDMDIQLSVMTAATTAEGWDAGGQSGGRVRNHSGSTTTNANPTTGPMPTPTTTTALMEGALAMQQAALDEARVERARALEDLRRYDELLAHAEQRLRLAGGRGAAAEGEVSAGEGGQEGQVQVEEPQPRVIPPPDNFSSIQPVHITLRLRDMTEGGSDSNTEEDMETEFYLVEDEDEELGEGLQATMAGRNEAQRRTTTPPIY
eukprot:evm.model.NODE_16051_length_12503_cov_36.466129.2